MWERGHSHSAGPARNWELLWGAGYPTGHHAGSDEYPTSCHSQPVHPSSGTGQENCHPTTPSALSSPEPLRSPFSHRAYQQALDGANCRPGAELDAESSSVTSRM